MAGRELNQQQERVLVFERSWWLEADDRSKGARIRAELGISPSRYHAILRGLVDDGRARAYDELLGARLERRLARTRRHAFTNEPPRLSRPH